MTAHIEHSDTGLKKQRKIGSKHNNLYNEKSIQKFIKLLLVSMPFLLAYIIYYETKRDKVFAFICIAIGIYFINKRDFYLPFLGDTVFPGGNLINQSPLNANVSKQIKVLPHQKVMYWAAEKNNKANPKQMPWTAYKDYSNSGLAIGDEKGIVDLKVRKPAPYSKPWGWFGSKGLRPHIHFRVQKTNGFWGRVQTVYL